MEYKQGRVWPTASWVAAKRVSRPRSYWVTAVFTWPVLPPLSPLLPLSGWDQIRRTSPPLLLPTTLALCLGTRTGLAPLNFEGKGSLRSGAGRWVRCKGRSVSLYSRSIHSHAPLREAPLRATPRRVTPLRVTPLRAAAATTVAAAAVSCWFVGAGGGRQQRQRARGWVRNRQKVVQFGTRGGRTALWGRRRRGTTSRGGGADEGETSM